MPMFIADAALGRLVTWLRLLGYDTVYPLRVIKDYITFHFDLPGAAEVLHSYPHDSSIVGARRKRARQQSEVACDSLGGKSCC